jgi:hypothetical protein
LSEDARRPRRSRLRTAWLATAALATVALVGALTWPVDGHPQSPVAQPPVAAGVIWAAPATTPVYDEWASISTPSFCYGVPTSTAATTDPHAAEETRLAPPGLSAAFAFMVTDNEAVCPGDNRRSELGQPAAKKRGWTDRLFAAGDERWISFQAYLPADLPLAPATTNRTEPWQIIAQWKQVTPNSGVPVLSMHVQGGFVALYASNTNVNGSNLARPLVDDTGAPARVRAVAGRWLRFTLHIRFSPDPGVGFLEWFGDLGTGMRQLWPQTGGPDQIYTMKVDQSGAPIPSAARIGIYRNAAIPGTSDLYIAGYTVASDRAAAEASAFGSAAGASTSTTPSTGKRHACSTRPVARKPTARGGHRRARHHATPKPRNAKHKRRPRRRRTPC